MSIVKLKKFKLLHYATWDGDCIHGHGKNNIIFAIVMSSLMLFLLLAFGLTFNAFYIIGFGVLIFTVYNPFHFRFMMRIWPAYARKYNTHYRFKFLGLDFYYMNYYLFCPGAELKEQVESVFEEFENCSAG